MRKLLVLIFVLVAAIAVVAGFGLWTSYRKPAVLVGGVVEKKIVAGAKDSYVVIGVGDDAAESESIVLRFETHTKGYLPQIMGDSFNGKSEELDLALDVGDRIRVETFDQSGLSRKVYRLVSVVKVQK